jgi:hypothetical protein
MPEDAETEWKALIAELLADSASSPFSSATSALKALRRPGEIVDRERE